MRALMGNYADMLAEFSSNLKQPMSFLADEWTDVARWQAETRAAVTELLSYEPAPVPMDVRVDRQYVSDGLLYEHISYAQPYGPRTEGILMRPENAVGKLPGFLALHDHGGFKYFGKEKLVALADEHPILGDFKREYYGGRSWATELAKRGYCVFVPDVFLWGSRKQLLETLPEWMTGKAGKHPEGSREAIEEYNNLTGNYETIIAKSLFLAGSTWPGIMAYDDRRALDYLLSRPEVDAQRVGCGGLSGGGTRTIFLSALDDRIRACCCVGFMCGFAETVAHRIQCHTWMFHLPGLAKLMDLHDLLSLHGPKPTMVLYDSDDPLWTLEGQQHSDAQLQRIYAKMDASAMYRGRFYPGGHKFDVPMQEDAFAFMDAHLKQEV